MMNFINNFLNSRRQKKLENKIADLQEQAMIHQRNGNLRAFAYTMEQITELEEEIND